MCKPLAASLLAIMSVCVSVSAPAQEALPKRKAGLWEITMQMQGQPGGMPAMKSQQCIDDKTDEAMQRKAMSGDGRAECKQTSLKKIANGVEMTAECKSAEGTMNVTSRMTGDMGSRYTMDNTVKFTPPRQGMSEARMQMTAQHAGACPAGMQPGDVRVGGMNFNPMQGMDPEKLKNMSPADRQKFIEQMMKAQQAGGAKP